MKYRTNPWISALSGLAAVAAGYIWGTATSRPAPLRITFLDAGQGDAAVVETPSGRCIVVDTGRASRESDRGRTTVLPYLRSRGVNRLDAVVLTHWDADHAGGAQAVLTGLSVPSLLVPRSGPWERSSTGTERVTLATTSRRRVRVTELDQRNRVSTVDGVHIDVLNPPRSGDRFIPRSDNDASVVLMVRYGSTRVLLAADAEAEAEHRIIRSGEDVRADVLKVAHHGSASGTSDRWLNAVRPKVAIVSVGRHNPFGHPDPRVLMRLRRRGVQVLRTDLVGAVTVTSNGSCYQVRTQRRFREGAEP